MSWTVSAPARLHFGLFDLGGDHGRIDGGAGVAIDRPRVVVKARAASSGGEPLPEALAELAPRLADRLGIDLPSLALEVVSSLPAHVGLGSHTQLALAAGTAMARASGLDLDAATIARAAGRGGTSGIGVHAFQAGGLVVDGGHSFGPGAEKEACRPSSASRAPVAPLIARYVLPETFRFVVVTPRTTRGASGAREVSLFEEAFPVPAAESGEIARRVLLGLMPGAARGDAALLGQSIGALQTLGFKRREVSLQPEPVRELLDVLVGAGATGAGLSSFGPTVYGLAEGEARAREALAAALTHLDRHGVEADGWVAAPDARGAVVTEG